MNCVSNHALHTLFLCILPLLNVFIILTECSTSRLGQRETPLWTFLSAFEYILSQSVLAWTVGQSGLIVLHVVLVFVSLHCRFPPCEELQGALVQLSEVR